MKYFIATIILFFAMFLGWFFSAKYLEPIILHVFTPQTHDKYLDIWFLMFTLMEVVIVIVYAIYVYKIYKSTNHLTKSSS